MSRALAQISKGWKAERARRFLWLPVCFAAGITLYFALPAEPPHALLYAIAALAFAILLLCRRYALAPCLAMLIITLAMAWAAINTGQRQLIRLEEPLEPRPVRGKVTYIERTEHGVRLTLEAVDIKDYPPEKTPTTVRLSIRLKAGTNPTLPHIGEQVSLMAGLNPPMGPVLPHGFDFARYFYFRGIGAVGYGLPPWHIRHIQPERSLADAFWDWRIRITEDVLARLGPQTGSIAAGLTTGDARAIRKEDFEALRASNLYHIIAISGEHMVIIAGVIFMGLRLLALAILPRQLAFRPAVKTIAAAASLILVSAYLFVTGLPISAVRAYVMIVLVLLAVMLRRQVDAMRSLALAALAMLIWDPASLLEPGFQLSFAATMALIALVEARLSQPQLVAEAGWPGRVARAIKTMFLISLVAEAATLPLVIAMFNNLSPYGVLANMLATPLVSLFLMPSVALYFVLLPLGLHGAALWLMDWGIRALLAIAHGIGGLPYAQLFLPSIPGYGVALVALGLCWICLWRTPIRRYGAVLMALGGLTMALPRPPDMLLGAELKQIVLKTPEGYRLARGRRGSMVPSLWANGLGYPELVKASPEQWQCESRNTNCIATIRGLKIAFPADAEHAGAACASGAIIVARQEWGPCPSSPLIIGPGQLKSGNISALWIEKNGALRLETSADWQGRRPWSAIPAAALGEE